ncbi:BQ2448_3208 [Microbotryum intermedium]|uniref:BQ2448_3208 protein n=1 Tax=Microbotryum intermedium TaxID=269621 RepID=A0A238FCQ9_9BASI|nr:BQ2448_3208 [Microbotryum intermedium]
MRLRLASTALAAVAATGSIPSTWAQSPTTAANTSSSSPTTASDLTTPYTPSAINLDTGANLTTTLKAMWTRNQSEGVFNDGLKLLSGDVSGATLYGALLRFDTTSSDNATKSEIPFVALVSCDQPITPSESTNPPSTGNGTSIFDSAASLGAQAVILYSSSSESCILDSSNNSATPLPVYSLPSQASTNLLLQQYTYITDAYQTFNSTALAELTGSFSSTLVPTDSSLSIPFLVAVITSNQTFENTSPIVATIGSVVPAASTTTSNQATTKTDSTSTTTTGAIGTSTTPSTTRSSAAGRGFAPGGLGGVGVLAFMGGLTLLVQFMM